jgi:molecular chaperone DnaK
VSAKDKATGKEQKIRIEASSGLSDTDIDKMVKSAEQHADDDRKRREAIEHRNQLDGLVYKVEKDSKEWVDRLSSDLKSRLDAAVEAGKQSLRTGDPDGIKAALDELNAAYQAAGASLYASSAGAPGSGSPEGEGQPQEAPETPKEDVVEADYEIVDENKSN